MKVAMMNFSRGWGGAEQILLSLCTSLRNQGHDLGIIVRDGAGTEAPFRNAGFSCLSVNREGWEGIRSIPEIIRHVRSGGFDTIHVHRNHDLIIGRIISLLSGRQKLVLTQHCQLGRTTSPIMNLADRIVCVSHFIADDMFEAFPSLRSKIEVIHNGVDLHLFENGECNYWSKRAELAGKGPFLGTTGYFYKNQEELVALLPSLKKIFSGVVLVIIGHDHSRTEWLKQKVEEAGVSDAVYFAGYIPYVEMKHALASLDLQVSAFRREGFGLSVIEGLAVGTPFIGYRAGGYGEIVVNGESGFLVETRDELVAVITDLLWDTNRLERIRRSARASAERYSLNSMIDRYESLYKEMI